MALNQRLGQIGYGSIFVILWPALLAVWAWRLDQSAMHFWPIPLPSWVGVALLLAGLWLMGISMRALWVIGQGLPMNAYPPPCYVTTSTYALFSHPIYVGFISLVAGVAIAAHSPAGLWVVTPVTMLAAVALVAGYEGPRLRERFGNSLHAPLLGLPANHPNQASWGRRLAATGVALGPWAMGYALLSTLPAPLGASELRWSWESEIPRAPGMIWVYSAAYPIAIAGPLLLPTQNALRRYVISAWLATVGGFLWMVLIPGHAELLPVSSAGLDASLFALNRYWDVAWLALPSFHVLWVVFAAYCFQSQFAKLAPIWILMVVAVALSCVLTGSHAIVDVIGGALLGMLCWHHERVWRYLLHYAEALANSWAAVCYGAVRIISHALWSFMAAAVGILTVIWLVGPAFIGEIAGVFTVALLSAGAWGYWLEGGTRLSRPFGYYGFLLGAIFSFGILALHNATTAQWLMAAFACGAPLAQAIGRLRCLVQGCCHGKPVHDAPGLCIVNPQSRVVALGRLHGVPIHPTQVYSIAGNMIIFIFLWRLWHWGATAPFIGGFYLILSSLARFVEEHYRGEPQTAVILMLSIYQWLAVLLFLVGIGVSMLDGVSVRIAADLTLGGWGIACIAGLLAGFLMSVDFPASNARFSRLTVNNP